MDSFLAQLSDIMMVDEELKADDQLKQFAEWDSMAALSVIAMLDSQYGAVVDPASLSECETVAQVYALATTARAGQ
jgi:acyl carrier protein